MNLDEVIRYPQGLTPHGEYHLLSGRVPMMSYHAYDGSIDFRMLGGFAAPFADPSQASIVVESIKGLVPPWQTVDQKGATQHGVTTAAALYDGGEVTAEIKIVGDDPAAVRRLTRDWIAANHELKTGELGIVTHEMGRWWADAHWYKTPPDKTMWAVQNRQPFTQVWRIDKAFWRSFDTVDWFGFDYASDKDHFDTNYSSGLGSGWTLNYSGSGGGWIYTSGGMARWQDDPANPILSDGRTVTCLRTDFETETDNQVVGMVIGSFPEWSFPDNAYNDLWARMDNGTPGQNGVRLRIGIGQISLSYFVSGVEHVLRARPLFIPPTPGEKWILVAGYENRTKLFRVFRRGALVMSVAESDIGVGSQIGASYRKVGFGMHAGAAIFTQATPAAIDGISVGDNNAVSQGGFVKLLNIGDRPMDVRYTCFGPGTFRFANGPGSSDYVEFGPLLTNQAMQVRTDPEERPVVDMTSVAATPQEQAQFTQALADYASFASAGNTPLSLEQIASTFEVVPPQGHPYSLLSGSFTSPIPAKSPGATATPQYIAVSIEGGNADSMIIAAGTPMRTYPL